MIYTPNDIMWIKHITNTSGGTAYLEPNNEFTLHVPTGSRNNATTPGIDEIIVLYQNINDKAYFTHLVTPIPNPINKGLIDDLGKPNYRPKYRYGRIVKVIAMTPIEKPIPRAKTGWQSVKFGGISQGNICEMSHISSISGIEDLKVELWDRFSSFFTLQNTESIATNQSIINELYVEQNTISVQEGRSKLISHLIRERDRTIIIEKKNAAIRNNTLKCEVCKFSFKDKYQVNFMECHHIDPIGSGIIRETTMERLALVCPNCHRMLHRKFENRFLSIDELKFRFHL